MRSIMRAMLVLALGGFLVACDQDGDTGETTMDTSGDTMSDPVEDTTPADTVVDSEPDTAPDTPACLASVSGSVQRAFSTCPPVGDFTGTLCISVRSDCSDATSEVASGTASISLGYPDTPASWDISDVPDGSWQINAFLDDDASGCDNPTTNDLVAGDGCTAVTVPDCEDVTGVSVILTAKQP